MKTGSVKFSKSWRHSLTDYVTALAWSPDGSWLAAASAVGEVVLIPVADTVADTGGAIALRSADDQSMNALGFSADGQYLAASGQTGEVTVWQVGQSGFPVVWQQSYTGTWIDQLAWHPGHSHLAYGVGSQVQIWDIAQAQQKAELEFADSSVLHLAWHPAEDLLAVSGHGGIKIWQGDDWAAEPKQIAVPGASLHVAWSADGRYLGSGNLDRTLTVAEWNSPPPWLMQGFPGKVRQTAWSQPVTISGSPLIAAACMDGVTVWEREQEAGGWQSRVLQHHRERVNAIAFQPHSLLLAAAGQDGIITLWQNGKTLAQTLKLPSGGCSTLAWHPAGDELAVAGTNGDIVVWQPKVKERAKGFGA
ncbi:MAG: WD40 repeat domain-containing protein [Thainema sp.]